MKVNIKNGILKIEYKLKKNETYRIAKTKTFQSVSIYKKPQVVSGYTNMCEDNKAILTIDYDGVDISVVKEDYKYIQNKFKLPQSYLFQTKKNNYHIVCLKKFLSSEVCEILRHTRCDLQYKTMPLRNKYRSYAIRISTKKGSNRPKFVKLIGDNINIKYQISTAHKLLFSKLYKNIKHPKYKKGDNLKIVRMKDYETAR